MLLCHDEAMETRDSNTSEPNNTEPNTEAFSPEQGELPDPVRVSLSDRKLLPIGSAPPAQRQLVPSERRIESARGAMLGTAIGDALGRPAEGRHPAGLRGQEEAFRDFQPWGGHYSGPKGTITDDTQMTMCVAESLPSESHLEQTQHSCAMTLHSQLSSRTPTPWQSLVQSATHG
jgi:hypothetical protein